MPLYRKGGGGGGGEFDLPLFTYAGVLTVQANALRSYAPRDCELTRVVLSLAEPSTGAPVIIDVNKNGSSVFATPPSIPAGEHLLVVDLPTPVPMTGLTDYLTVDVDQVGSTAAGTGLVAQFTANPT